ncbi:MAG: hypothetical protein HQL08_08205 [Nitrospirae bacterium]|nr:hypothetical protein [Nitrospirota bacterium]
MNKVLIYSGALILGLLSVASGFYLVPVYKLPLEYRSLLGPKAVYWTYFIFAIAPVTIYYRWVLRVGWTAALLKGIATVALNFAVIGLFVLLMRSAGKW